MSREGPPRFGLINDGNKREEYLSVLRGVAVQWQSLDERKMEKSRKADSRDKGKKGESRVGDHFLESMQQHASCYVVESPNFLEEW